MYRVSPCQKRKSASPVLHSYNVKTQICVTRPQCVTKHWNNKFYYTVASCWLFLYDLYYDARIDEHHVYKNLYYDARIHEHHAYKDDRMNDDTDLREM